ncbi:hypothetical protein HELRODRAFT_78031 [Helobdella robusta]|uniref:PCI domain-containing protein n=1 Tax=Helobdella robusta TaxID=6412 RepID=T1G370_HELRO|nr:hypothetical protein HELRODRAFT_78031 [Helobdella robusta]ESO05273.1 hypothetical protein HELRODRAFT_78031 [Helobdella robusta]
MDKSVNHLEQFLLLAKTTKGAAAVELVKQALETPGIYVFGELLDAPNIIELASGTNKIYYDLLTLFAYGTLLDYNKNRDKYPTLSKNQLQKLRHLTIVSLATKSKCLSYDVLLKELDFTNLRELEDLIIEVICVDIVRGKLDQKQQQLFVEYALGRDVRPEDVKYTIQVFDDWCQGCESVLHNIEMLAKDANNCKDNYSKRMSKIEQEVI